MSIPAEVLVILDPLVKSFESCRLEAYQDGGGIWTIGWGHTGTEVTPKLVWTQAQADSTLAADLAQNYVALLQCSPTLAKTSAGRQSALTDFVYNLGIGRYMHSTLRSAVDCGAWQAVKFQLAKWDHGGGVVVPGLARRRKAEITLIDG